jgi:ankyrin repeat protein
MSGCTAALYAAQCHVSVLNFLLRNGALVDINKSSEIPPVDEEEDMSRPPLFEAVIFGKLRNILALLDAGADANVVMNPEKQLSVLHCCAEHGFEDLPTIDRFLQQGVEVDKAPLDFETPFASAVTNRCFKLGGLLRQKGADPNALYRQGLFGSATYHSTLLGFLVNENSHCSIPCIDFLLRKDSDYIPVNLTVTPILNHTVYHKLALLRGDSQDPVATSIALSLCTAYFNPNPQDLNQVTACDPNPDGSVESKGGNTALHLAVMYANFEVVKWLLLSVEGVSTSIRNASGFTAVDLAALSYPKFLLRFVPLDIPKHPKRQAREAKLRREAIWTLLKRYSPQGVTEGLEESFTLEEDADVDELEVDMDVVADKGHVSKC